MYCISLSLSGSPEIIQRFLFDCSLISFPQYFISILSECNGSKQLRFTDAESFETFTSRPAVYHSQSGYENIGRSRVLSSRLCQREKYRLKNGYFAFPSLPHSLVPISLLWVPTTALSHSLHLARFSSTRNLTIGACAQHAVPNLQGSLSKEQPRSSVYNDFVFK